MAPNYLKLCAPVFCSHPEAIYCCSVIESGCNKNIPDLYSGGGGPGSYHARDRVP